MLTIICVKGHLNRKKLFKYPYLLSNTIRISAASYSADTHTNPNISTNSKPNSKIYYGVNQRPIWGLFMKKTRGRQSRASVPLSNNCWFVIIAYYYISVHQIWKIANFKLSGAAGALKKEV
jgi:hypothetical protein